MKSKLKLAVGEQNKLNHTEVPVGAAIVKILKPNKYMNEQGRAVECVEGVILTTMSNYAQTLVDQGSACFPDAAEVRAMDEPEPEPDPVPTFADVPGIKADAVASLEATGATWEKIAEMDQKSLVKVPGLGPKTAAKLKTMAAGIVSGEVLDAAASTD